MAYRWSREFVRAEMFPLCTRQRQSARTVSDSLNLPRANKMVELHFSMPVAAEDSASVEDEPMSLSSLKPFPGGESAAPPPIRAAQPDADIAI